ncbi:hypothetical protein LJR231_003873 [Phyllobacterium sp. LjRoot231]|uniref:hypothetical protein n=1 Tax=Phyllobacterium sp. LjRoot231 TaxID=3342289 RepID=UPI003ECF6385
MFVSLPGSFSPEGPRRKHEILPFLGLLGPELSVRWRGAPNLELTWQLHHRSGANGTFGNTGEGSNANVFGIRYRF